MSTALNPEHVIRIIDKRKGKHGGLIGMLWDIQSEYNYLPRGALKLVAQRTGHSLVDIYGVATFYKSFSLEPRGRHLVSVCMGTACHVRQAPRVLDEIERTLEIKAGETTPDRNFSLATVNCLGACALGPVVVVDGECERNVNPSGVRRQLQKCSRDDREQQSVSDEHVFRVDVACPECNRSLMTYDHLMDGHPMIHVTASFGRKHGWLRLSSLWGDYRRESEHEIPEDTIVNFFCPRCHAELRSTRLCPRCDAPTIPLFVRSGGIVQVCSRHGCKEHLLDLSG
jgi:NADH:ubiquinone oxidoreductase subunit E